MLCWNSSPLNKLTEGHMNGKKIKKYIECNNEAEEAFVKLKEYCWLK